MNEERIRFGVSTKESVKLLTGILVLMKEGSWRMGVSRKKLVFIEERTVETSNFQGFISIAPDFFKPYSMGSTMEKMFRLLATDTLGLTIHAYVKQAA